jgi:hypothetical protein
MKRMIPLLWGIGLLLTSGCISTHLVRDKAQPHFEYSAEQDKLREVDGKPGNYALLPLTIVGDVATSPFQLGYFLITDHSHSGSANIRGVPVPLP